MTSQRITQTALLVGAVVLLLGNIQQAEAQLGPIVSKTKIGNPAWEPVDFHLFSGPLEVNGFADIGPFLESLLPAPNHASHPDLGIGPGAAHAPPYDTELGDGIVNAGVEEKTVFLGSEWSDGYGVYWAWMNVPSANPAMGSSPDFANGPIIPNADFPIDNLFSVDQDGMEFEPDFGNSVPALDGNLNPPFNVDGHSHYPQFVIDGHFFAADPSLGVNGMFEYRARQRDSSGNNGWDLVARFQVVPEPSTLLLAAIGLCGSLGCARPRRIARKVFFKE